MTDQTIPADDLRRFIARARTAANGRGSILLDELEALLPAPKRPTLADMTEEERAACRWMQCDYAGETSDATSPGVIGYFDHGGKRAVILTAKCGIVRRDYDRVTPRPDLPRLEWPGTGQGGEEVTKVDYVSVAGGRTAYGPWTVARLRKKPEDVAPVKVGDVIESADDPRLDALPEGSVLIDRDEDATTKRGAGFWLGDGYTPVPSEGDEFGPWKVLHTPKEADQ